MQRLLEILTVASATQIIIQSTAIFFAAAKGDGIPFRWVQLAE